MTERTSAAVSRFTALATLTPADLGDLAKLAGGTRSLKRGEYVCHEGDEPSGLYLLLSGWAASSLTFANGARQLIKVHLPGDLLGSPSLVLERSIDSIVAVTPIEIGVISIAALGELFERNPRLAALLFMISLEERVHMTDRLASIGATEAINRLAALLLHIHQGVARSDPSIGETFTLPLSQTDVADLIGITAVHLNRTLQRLRERRIVRWVGHMVTLLDRETLNALAGQPVRMLRRDPTWLPKRG